MITAITRTILVAAILSSGCASPLERALDTEKTRLKLVETQAKIQETKLMMCQERTAHSIKCDQCDVAKDWHKKRWN